MECVGILQLALQAAVISLLVTPGELQTCDDRLTISTVLNEEVLFRIGERFAGMKACYIESPKNETWTVNSESDLEESQILNDRLLFWGNFSAGDCGIRIRNISQSDTGTWTLASILGEDNNSHSLCSEIAVGYVSLEDLNIKVAAGSKLSWNSSTDKVSYCDIHRPDGNSYEGHFTGNCIVNIDSASFSDAGTWTVSVGYPGKTDEIQQKVNIEIEEVSLDIGVVQGDSENGSISFYCNLKSSFYRVNACRFKRPGDQATYRMTVGVGTDKYVYFGNGIQNNECGITIFQPEEVDYGLWECMLFISSETSEKIITAFVALEKEATQAEKDLQSSAAVTRNLLYREGDHSTVFCKVDWSLQACTLLSPGKELFSGDVNYIHSGWCRSPVLEIKEEHSGIWTCFMTLDIGVQDITSTINVTVSRNLISPTQPTIYATLGETNFMLCHSLIEDISFSYCWFKDPSGLLIDTMANTDGYSYYGAGIEYGECGLEVKHVGPQHIGKWECKVEIQGESNEHLTENIALEITDFTTKVSPSYIESVEGNEVILKLIHSLQSLQNCVLQTPDGISIDLQPDQPVNISATTEALYYGIVLQQGDCRVRLIGLKATNTFQMWRLSAVSTNGTSVEGVAFVNVSASMELHSAWKLIEVNLGTNVTLTCGESLTKDYCIFKWPNENISSGMKSSCSLTLSPVTKLHLGNWTCHIGIPHSMKEILETITVTNIEPKLSSNIESEDVFRLSSAVHMKCSIPRSLTFCRFMPPNSGTALLLSEGTDIGNYSYFGAGLSYGHCGLHISSIGNDDIGSWQCSVGWEENGAMKYASVIIKLGNSNNETSLNNGNEILAVNGSRLEVSCYINTKLSYCWFRHPNGSQILPEQKDDLLSKGQCSTIIQVAEYSDSGLWECHLGDSYSPGDEIIDYTSVIITGTKLSAEGKHLIATSGSSIYIKCKSVPIGTSLQYCRFVRPDGTNIPAIPGIMQEHYEYHGDGLEKGICGLQINGAEKGDIGEWMCAGLLQGENLEDSDRIWIDNEETSVAVVSAVGASSAIAFLLVLAITVWGIRKWRKSSEQSTPPVVFSDLIRSASQSDASSISSLSNSGEY